ncbi:MAG: PD-(D/E)XK nuclease family protein, partial [Clostridiales bacterium]|nr:PD-(D/E)XK nuclease family protein [Candidatus Apopatousia equi]
MNVEQMIFDALNIESTFNIQVMSLTRLVDKVCSKVVDKTKVLDKDSGVLLVSKIMLENKDNLKKYTSIDKSSNLAEKIYETIVQFKSSGIKPDEVKSQCGNITLNDKLDDLKFIYEMYEEKVENDLIDSADLLDIFCRELKTNNLIKTSSVYMGLFDFLTFKQLSCVKSLAENSQSFSISLSANTLQTNKHIYLNEMFALITDIFKSNNIEYKIFNNSMKGDNDFSHLSKNLFGIEPQKQITKGNVVLVEAETEKDEISFVARKIKQLVVENNYNFDDFNIVCSSLENFNSLLKEKFDEYNFPYYFDCSMPLTEHFFGRFVLNCLEVISKDFERENVLEFLRSPFVNLERKDFEEFENFVLKNNIDKYKFFNNYDDQTFTSIQSNYLQFFKDLKESIKQNRSITNYIDCINVIFEKFNVQEVLTNLSSNSYYDIDFQKSTSLVFDAFNKVVEKIKSMMQGTICDFEYFISLLSNVMTSAKINTVPLGVNRIFVGDINTSSFAKKKVMFLLGAVAGKLPSYSDDCGIITDTEILELSSKNLLSPSIRFLNKRKKFNTFECMLMPYEKLFVSFSNLSKDSSNKPSEAVFALQNCLTLDGNSTLPIYKISEELNYLELKNELYKDDISKNFVYADKQRLYDFASTKLENNYENILARKVLDIENMTRSNTRKDIKDAGNLFFTNNSISVSELEKYFACPYKHFVDYGLRVKEREVGKLKVCDIGNIMHKIAELFVKDLINSNFAYNEQKIEEITNQVLDENKILDSVDFDTIRTDNLISEAKMLCDKIYNQILVSEFKPHYVEQEFKNFNYGNISLKGKVDRIDLFNDYFTIIDYKTGKSDFSFKDVFYGNKIQTIIYLSVVEQLYKKTPVGAFYFPVKNKFIEEGDFDRMDGVFLNVPEVYNKLDIGIERDNESKYLNISMKDGKLITASNNYALDNDQLNSIKAYAKQLVNIAVEEIKSGYITPKPTKDACKYCEYKLLCKFNCSEDGTRKNDTRITKSSFDNVIKNQEADNGKN